MPSSLQFIPAYRGPFANSAREQSLALFIVAASLAAFFLGMAVIKARVW